ncbi:hypothetical protein CPJCM30710_15600 [Clostridium polyendosporum]|uniref:Transporter n=1 Tax=Clostridium polyendosporum TaxID=69208 RepID=A0A919RZY6_9CLOT|nr:hypothetical protein [Clostridium polyendosporum]GIM28894.1 hypothetical protein CPJCM30710_15600 [Clostridium polyendosporum]
MLFFEEYNDNFFYPNSQFRFFNDGEDIDEVGEYEVDLNYTYAPIYENPAEDRAFQGRQLPPPPQANIPPVAPPPSFLPSKTDKNVKTLTTQAYPGYPSPGYPGQGPSPQFVSPGSIRPCLYKFTYIWQRNGRSYWAYPTRIDRRSISGWRWLGWRWVYFGVDLRRIDSFICY